MAIAEKDKSFVETPPNPQFKQATLRILKNYLYDMVAVRLGETTNLRPLFFTLYSNLSCNFNCSYCGFAQTGLTKARHNELDTESVVRLLQICQRETSAFYITGGEPLVRPDIVEIVKAARDVQIRSLGMSSNMSLIDKKPEVLDHVTDLSASLDMIDPQRYSKTLGVSPKTIERVQQNIIDCSQLQRKKGFQLTVNCVVTPETIPDAREVMEFCFNHGCRFTAVPVQTEGNTVDPRLRENKEYHQLIDDMLAAKKQGNPVFGQPRFLKTLRDLPHFDCLPTLVPHINHRGELYYPCEPIGKTGCNLLEVGNYQQALRQCIDKFGPIPRCSGKCYKSCYIEPVILVKSLVAAIKEITS